MDEINTQIIRHLRRDARTPYTEIAEEIGASEGTVRNRVNELVDSGVIKRFTVSTSKGSIRVFVGVKTKTETNASKVCNEITSWSEVDYVWSIGGDEDILVLVDAVDTKEVSDVVSRIRGLDATASTETRLVLDEKI